VLATETGRLTAPGRTAEISDPPDEPELPPEELLDPLPEPLLSTETGRLTAPGSPSEISEPLPPLPPWPPLPPLPP